MAVKQVFESADGRTYPTVKAAEKRDAMVAAAKQFEEAGKELVKCIGESALTADGKPFNMRSSQHYWFIADSFTGLPRLIDLWLWPHHASVEIDHQDQVVFRYLDDSRREYIDYPIRELYADKEAAYVAYADRCEQRIEELREEVQDALSKARL